MKRKSVLTNGLAFLFIIGLIFLFYQAVQGITTPITPTESFSQALWGTWGATIVVMSFIIFAGGAGILVLLGGGWRWE
jgi:hypothetical protein